LNAPGLSAPQGAGKRRGASAIVAITPLPSRELGWIKQPSSWPAPWWPNPWRPHRPSPPARHQRLTAVLEALAREQASDVFGAELHVSDAKLISIGCRRLRCGQSLRLRLTGLLLAWRGVRLAASVARPGRDVAVGIFLQNDVGAGVRPLGSYPFLLLRAAPLARIFSRRADHPCADHPPPVPGGAKRRAVRPLVIDQLSGLGEGSTTKYLSAARARTLTTASALRICEALGVKCVLVADEELTRRMQARGTKRDGAKVHARRPPSLGKTQLRRYFKLIGRRGARARWHPSTIRPPRRRQRLPARHHARPREAFHPRITRGSGAR
jgi:hypothetical protein